MISGSNQTIIPDLLKTIDANNTDDQLIYTLVTIPEYGELQKNWTGKLLPGAQFTQTELNNGAVRYFSYGAPPTGSDEFCFTVTDGEGGLIKDCFDIQIPVSAPEQPARSIDFMLAPNPATETARLVFAEAPDSDTRIRVFDTSGRMLRNLSFANGQLVTWLSISDWPKGIYTVIVDNANGSGVRKLVVQ